jgi:hypothetical protein
MTGRSSAMTWGHALVVVTIALTLTAVAIAIVTVVVFLLSLAGTSGGSGDEGWTPFGIAASLALLVCVGAYLFGGAFAIRQVMLQVRSQYEVTFRDALRVPLTAILGPIAIGIGYGVTLGGVDDDAIDAIGFIVAVASIFPVAALVLRRRAYPRLLDPPPPVNVSPANG